MHKDRAIWVSLAVLGLAFAAWMLRETGGEGWIPGCFFKQATGFDCPGCGMTRATYAIMHGRIGEAFRFNPVGMVLLPLVLIAVGFEVLGWVRGKPLPIRLNPGRRVATVILVVIIVWWVGRNLV